MAAHIDLEKMKKLLAMDVPQVVVASALGCTEGYVSQCLSSEQFQAEVQALKLAKLESADKRDLQLEAIEDKLVEKIAKAVDYMLRPQELLGAFKVINGRQRSVAVAGAGNQQAPGQVVNITLPAIVALNFVKNSNSEIIEAGGRSLTTLPSSVLKQMAFPQQLLPPAGAQGNERKNFARKIAENPQSTDIAATAFGNVTAKAA